MTYYEGGCWSLAMQAHTASCRFLPLPCKSLFFFSCSVVFSLLEHPHKVPFLFISRPLAAALLSFAAVHKVKPISSSVDP